MSVSVRHHPRPHPLRRGLLAAVVTGALLLLSTAPVVADDDRTPPPFGFSTFAAEGRQQSQTAAPITGASLYPSAILTTTTLSVASNTNIIGTRDVTQQATIDSTAVKTCNPGKQTAQNETTIAVNPSDASNLVAGANDYRLFEPSENRYDGSGGFYRSTNGGTTWMAGFLPGLVLANLDAPGPYEAAGDPAVAAGPLGVFWYANLAFNRSDNANSVAMSRSLNGGSTWTTTFVIQTSAADGATLFNDKEWVGAHPSDSSTAYVTWTQFHTSPTGRTRSSPIVISKTTNGGTSWTAPTTVSPFKFNQGSVVFVDGFGTVHVTYIAFSKGKNVVAYSRSSDGGNTFATKVLATVNAIPSPLPGATFRVNSFPAFALDGSSLHVVWSNWNGSDADVVYIRSTDGGTSWTSPVTVAGGAGDQFFPWIAAKGSKVFASWFDRAIANDSYTTRLAASSDSGVSWSAAQALSSASSNVQDGNAFRFPTCVFSFIGDYSGIAVGSDGVAHPIWTDIRIGNDTATTADQDPYTASVTIP